MKPKPIYWPTLHGDCDCSACEAAKTCHSYQKFQRTRQDFSYTSGRCPKLPNVRGFVEDDWQAAYREAFPLVKAWIGHDGVLYMTVTVPGDAREKKLYRTRYNEWYFIERRPGGVQVKRYIDLGSLTSKRALTESLERIGGIVQIRGKLIT